METSVLQPTQPFQTINSAVLVADAYDVNAPLNLGSIAYENHHAPVFHAWLNLDRESRRGALRDRYVFLSVSNCVDQHLGDLLKLDFEKANEFVGEIIEGISYLVQARISYTEEWFKSLDQLAGTFTDRNYLPEARSIVATGFWTGVVKFPRSAQSLTVHAAYLDALVGRREKAAKVALRLVRKPFLLPNRRELPKLYQKLMYILSASNHLDEYKLILWKGASSFHANGVLRDIFVSQIVKTYRGAFRTLLHREVSLAYRVSFLLGNIARIVAANSFLAVIRAHLPLRWLHSGYLYFLDFLSLQKNALSGGAAQPPGPIELGARKPRSLLRRAKNPRILVTRAMGGIGDLLMMMPGLKALALKSPNTKVDFAIPKSFHPIFEGFSTVRLLDINEDEIDLTNYHRWVNLTDCPAGRVESRQYPNVRRNRIESFARAMGISRRRLRRTSGFLPTYRVSEEEREWAKNSLLQFNPEGLPVVGIQPFAADSYKNWPFMEGLTKTLSQDHAVLIFHHEEIVGHDGPNIHKILAPLRKSIALLAECKNLVAVDSSFIHISAALGIKTVAIFGPTSGRVFCRYYPNVKYVAPIKSDFPCYPCWRNEHKPCHLTNGRESICFRSITVEKVISILNGDPGQWRQDPNTRSRFKTWVMYGRE